MVKHAVVYGIKPTARAFDTTAKTVRKWLERYRQERLAGLNELPRIPLSCPHKTSSALARKIVNLRKQFPFKGAKRLKREHNLSCSHEAIRRILHEKDIPHYWPQMKALKLPKYQFTAREVRSGLMFLGFANQCTAVNGCLFAHNMNKDDKSPWQIIKKVKPKVNIELTRLPPLMLDWLGPDYITREELSLRGYDLPCYPYMKHLTKKSKGRLFQVTFRKRSNGQLRTLFCQTDNRPDSEVQTKFHENKNLLLVWDLDNKTWRTIPIEGLLALETYSGITMSNNPEKRQMERIKQNPSQILNTVAMIMQAIPPGSTGYFCVVPRDDQFLIIPYSVIKASDKILEKYSMSNIHDGLTIGQWNKLEKAISDYLKIN